MVTKVFISQPMRNYSQEAIEYDRGKAIDKCKELFGKDVDIIDSQLSVEFITSHNSLECLAESIKRLARADVAYFCPHWESARGCKIEHSCAVEYGIRTIYG